MNKSLLVSALLAMAMSGCSLSPEEQARRDKQHAEWGEQAKAQYKITVIDNAGNVLREWTSREVVDVSHGAAIFVNAATGKKIKVGGNFIVEQL